MAKQPTPPIIEAEAQPVTPEENDGIIRRVARGIWFLITLPIRIIIWPFTIILRPFRRLYRKWYGPAPLMFGAVPVDHSEPDFESEEDPGMFKGQIVFLLITGFFIIAFYWASTAELDEQVRADGAVIPPSDIQIVQSRLPGSITEIHVDLGTQVEKGDVLFRVEDNDVQADYAENEVIIASRKAAIIRLQAEVNDATAVTFPGALKRTASAAVAEEANLFIQRAIAARGRIDVIEQSIEELNRNIAEKRAEVGISLTQYRIQKQEYDLLKPLVDAGHESKLRLIEAETKWRGAEGTAELAQLAVAAMEARREGLRKEILSVKSQRRAESSSYLVEAQTGLAQAMARQESLQGRVAYADIRAPAKGTISALHIKTIGAVVQAGTLLTEIVPLDAEHVVRAKLLPQDVADVALGQLARISLSAYDVSRYGALEGEVVHVSSNTTEEQNAPPYYEMMISIGDKGFPNSNIVPDIVPGMQVTVDIIGGKRTVLDYILSPIQKATAVAFREK